MTAAIRPAAPAPLLIYGTPGAPCERCLAPLPRERYSVKYWRDERPDGFWIRRLLHVCEECATDPAWAAERDEHERANRKGKLLTFAIAIGKRKVKRMPR